MLILIFVLAIMACVAADVALILVIKERKSRQQESRAMRKKFADYVQVEVGAVCTRVKEVDAKADRNVKAIRAVNSKAEGILKEVKKDRLRIEDLEQGVVPDFEAARKAVDAVNDVNKGIAGILNYDPLEALKASRQEGVISG